MRDRLCAILWLVLFVSPAYAGPAPESEGPASSAVSGGNLADEEESSFDRLQRRQGWFNHIRQYPAKTIPADARRKAIARFNRMRLMERKNRSALSRRFGRAGNIADSSAQWTQIGPQPSNGYWGISSGRATSVVVDPRDSQVAFLGTAGGGVWKTVDGGKNWSPLTDQQPSLAIGSLALDPSNPATIYAGTGEQDFSGDSYTGEGILKSTDGGQTWLNVLGPFAKAEIGTIAVNPANSNVVLAGALAFTSQLPWGGALLRSADGGNTWNVVLSGMTNTVVFDAVQANVVYAGLGGYGDGYSGIYKSTDGGQTWGKLSGSGLPTIATGRLGLAVDPTRGGVLYAAIADPLFTQASSSAGIYKTLDGGSTWSLLQKSNGSLSCCTWYENGIAVDPANPNVIFTGGFAVSRSLDGGATWSNVSTGSDGVGVHPDQHAFAFSNDGSVLYAANDGGAWAMKSPSATPFLWSSLNNSISTITFYPGLGLDPNDPNTAMAGTQDNSVEGFSGSLAWTDIDGNCGDGSSASIDPTNTKTAYNYCIGQIFRSVNSGPWTLAMNGIDPADPGAWVAPLVLDPSHSSTLYYGAKHLYQSVDGAATWQQVSPVLDSQASINAISAAPSNSNIVYAGTGSGRMFLSSNANLGTAATWAEISGGLPHAVITRIAVDAQNSGTAYVTVGGFGNGHVWKTSNSGTAWADISGGLPDAPANDVLVDPDMVQTLYVAMDVGVFYTVDGGTTWATLSQGLPQVVVQSIGLVRQSRILRAITHGRSAWDLEIPIVPLVVSTTQLSFADQVYQTASTPLIVTVINESRTALNQFAVSLSGDFSQTNACGTSIPAGASCAISVVFSPSVAGSRMGTLTVSSQSVASAMVALEGKGVSTFSIAPASSNASVRAGQAASYTMSIAPLGGSFGGNITFLCSGLPAETQCSFSPSSLAPGTTAGTVALQVATTAPSAMLNASRRTWQMAAILLLLPLSMFMTSGARQSSRAILRFTFVMVLGLLTTSCGGGGSSSSNGPLNPGTAAGTYNFTVTGTSASQSVAAKLTLTVQ